MLTDFGGRGGGVGGELLKLGYIKMSLASGGQASQTPFPLFLFLHVFLTVVRVTAIFQTVFHYCF